MSSVPGRSAPGAQRLLIRMPNWLGDIVMATSAIEALHRTGKYALHLFIRSPWDELFRHDPRVAQVIVCNDRGGRQIFKTAAAIRRMRFDSAVDFTHSIRSRLIWKLAGIGRIFRERSRSGALGAAPSVSRDILSRSGALGAAHQITRYLGVIRDLTGPGVNVPWPPVLSLPPSTKQDPAKAGEILLFPAAAYGPAKMWSAGHYRTLINRMAERGYPVRILGTASERPFLEEISNGFESVIRPAETARAARAASGHNPQSAIRISSGLSLPDLLRLIAGADAVICCDSGAAHLAAALGKPCVVLFLSTDPLRTSPVGFAVRNLVAHVPCRPCFLRACPIGYLCRDAITPESVMTHLDEIFDIPPKKTVIG